jgi:hypothetical protein
MSLGRTAFVGGIALHGAESVESPFCCEAGVPVLVERCQPLRNKNRRGRAISGAVARPLDCSVLARVPRRREMESQLAAIRQRTHGRPWGSAEFVHGLEKATQRRLTPQKRGPREKIITDRSQPEFIFES